MFVEQEVTAKRIRKEGTSMHECVLKFHDAVSVGPVYICSVCHQTWFKHSVSCVPNIIMNIPQHMHKHLTNIVSVGDNKWICKTCLNALKLSKTPKLAVSNGCSFPLKPAELTLHPLEERLIAQRIPFMQMRSLPRGGQFSVKGNVVNVPVDIAPTVASLPRNMNETQTIAVKLKRKLQYNKAENSENVRPAKVLNALKWLQHNSALYKDTKIDPDWLPTFQEEILKDTTDHSFEDERKCPIEKNNDNVLASTEDDTYSEVDETEFAGNLDTLLQNEDITIDDEDGLLHDDEEYIFAPGEGQNPISMYKDPDAEYLAFPSLYCGQKRPSNKDRDKPVYYSDICKGELRNYDRRAAMHIPSLFFKLKKIQMKQVADKVKLVMRRCQKKGTKLTAKEALDPAKLNQLVRLDEGYFIFRTLRNTPVYFESRKKDLFAMIRQLGLPTWFMSLSAADSRWIDLLQILGKLVDGKDYSPQEIEAMNWEDRTRLIRSDPVTCSRYFDNRVHKFMKTVLQNAHNPLGEICDSFVRVEFQHRGSPHVHMLLWTKNAPNMK